MALLTVFVVVERRASEPVLPLWVFRMRVLNVANAGSFVVGVLLMGLSSYVPLFSQKVLGTGALVAGLILAAMTIGWPIAASTAGRLYLTVGFRFTFVLGGVVAVLGSLILVTVDRRQLPVAPRARLPGDGRRLRIRRIAGGRRRADRGPVVAAWRRDRGEHVRPLGRQRGGVAIFGAVVNSHVSSRLGTGSPDLQHVSAAVLEPAIHDVFLVSVFVSVALLALSVGDAEAGVEPRADAAA